MHIKNRVRPRYPSWIWETQLFRNICQKVLTNSWAIFGFHDVARCLKIAKNVAFDFLNFNFNNFLMSYQNWPVWYHCLTASFSFSKTRQIDHFLHFLMNFCPKGKRSSLPLQCCEMRIFLRFSNTVMAPLSLLYNLQTQILTIFYFATEVASSSSSSLLWIFGCQSVWWALDKLEPLSEPTSLSSSSYSNRAISN